MSNSKIEGKRFSRVRKTDVDPESLFAIAKVVKVGQSAQDRLEEYASRGLAMMNDVIEREQIKLNPLFHIASQKHDFPRDSKFDLGQRLYIHARKALNERHTVEQRINHAIEAGIVYQLAKTYTIESGTNSGNKKGKIFCPELDELVIGLIEDGHTHGQIWDALPEGTDGDSFYKDGDKLCFLGTEKSISKHHFIKKKVGEIKKRNKK